MVLWLNQGFTLKSEDQWRRHEVVNLRPWRGAAKASLATLAPAFGVVAIAAGDVVR
jgi:hypothetical protein